MREKTVKKLIESLVTVSNIASREAQRGNSRLLSSVSTLQAQVERIAVQKADSYEAQERQLKEFSSIVVTELASLRKTIEDHQKEQHSNSQNFNSYAKWLIGQVITGAAAVIGAGSAKYIYDNYLSSVSREQEEKTFDDLIKKYFEATDRCSLLALKIQEADLQFALTPEKSCI